MGENSQRKHIKGIKNDGDENVGGLCGEGTSAGVEKVSLPERHHDDIHSQGCATSRDKFGPGKWGVGATGNSNMTIKQEIFKAVERVADLQKWEPGRVWGCMKKKFGCSLADADEAQLEERKIYINNWLKKLEGSQTHTSVSTDEDWQIIYEIAKRRLNV